MDGLKKAAIQSCVSKKSVKTKAADEFNFKPSVIFFMFSFFVLIYIC